MFANPLLQSNLFCTKCWFTSRLPKILYKIYYDLTRVTQTQTNKQMGFLKLQMYTN